jgi:hypothetical protein
MVDVQVASMMGVDDFRGRIGDLRFHTLHDVQEIHAIKPIVREV